eukprot:5135718-Amphidinium_carterae.1
MPSVPHSSRETERDATVAAPAQLRQVSHVLKQQERTKGLRNRRKKRAPAIARVFSHPTIVAHDQISGEPRMQWLCQCKLRLKVLRSVHKTLAHALNSDCNATIAGDDTDHQQGLASVSMLPKQNTSMQRSSDFSTIFSVLQRFVRRVCHVRRVRSSEATCCY